MGDDQRTVPEPRRGRDTPARVTRDLGTPIDRFELGEEIARGGMGRVTEAHDKLLDRYVAIKQVIDGDPETISRFERETAITARLEHPSIVPLYDAGRGEDGNPYYVMRRVDGRRLSDLIAEKPSVSARLALLPLVLAACDAIAHAHRRGVIHRDIKPGNILVGDLGETIVIDWGLAKVIDEADDPVTKRAPTAPLETVAGVVMGTPGYMAPEQLRGETASPRSDVYALGATLYHVLSGKIPHEAKSSTEMMVLGKQGPPAPLQTSAPGAPRDLVSIVETAMAREPAERFADASDLAAEVRRFLTGQLVAAHDYSLRERVWRFIQRHRIAVGVAIASLVAIAVIASIAVTRVVAARDVAIARSIDAETARGQEADRADELLVERARLLAPRDPIAAIAQLRKLRANTKLWRRARSVAAEAATHGLPWLLEAGALTVDLVVTRDAKRAYSSSTDGVLWEHDLEARTSKKLRTGDPALLALADDDRKLFLGGTTSLVMRKLDTGEEVVQASSKISSLSVVGTTVAWVDENGAHVLGDKVFNLPVKGADIAVSPGGKRIAVYDPKGVTVLEDGAVIHKHEGKPWHVAWSPDGELGIADYEGGFVVSWHDGKPVEEQHTPYSCRLALWIGDRWVFAAGDNFVYRRGEPAPRKSRGALDTMHSAAVDSGAIFDTGRRELVVAGPLTDRVIRLPGSSLAVAGAKSRAVVAIPGRVLVYELAPILPRVVTLPKASYIFHTLIDERQYLSTSGETSDVDWTVFDLDGGPTRSYGRLGIARRTALVGDVLFAEDLKQHFRYARIGQPAKPIAETVTGVAAAGTRAVLVDGQSLKLFDPATEQTTPLFDAPGQIGLLATSTRYLAALVGDKTLVRIALATNQRDEIAIDAKPEAIFVDDAGLVHVAHGQTITRWDGRTLAKIATLVAKILRFSEAPGLIAIDIHNGAWTVDANGATRRLLPPRTDVSGWTHDGELAAARTVDGEHRVYDLVTRDFWELPFNSKADRLLMSPAGTRIVAPYDGGIGVYGLVLPADGPAYEAWVGRLTNLSVDEVGDVVFPQ